MTADRAPTVLRLETPHPRGGEAPTPAETDAFNQEELRASALRGQNPAAKAFAAFLRDPAQAQKATPRGDPLTNIIDQGERATYHFPDETVGGLFGHLDALRREKVAAHFSERQGRPDQLKSGLMLDYDLVVGTKEARFEEPHAARVVQQLVGALQQALDLGGGEAALHVFTTVKAAPAFQAEGRWKYGFHVLVPGLRLERPVKKHLLGALRDNEAIHRVLAELGARGDPRECLDANSASVPVLFYGSCKRGGGVYEGGPSYEVRLPGAGGGFPMVAPLRLAELEAAGYNLVAEASLCHEARYADGRRPLVPALWKAEPRPEVKALLARQEEGAAERGRGVEDEMLLAEHALSVLAVRDPEARYLHQLLDLLKPEYYTERNRWRDVIYALANTSESYKPLAEWFSRKAPAKWADGGQAALDQLWAEAAGGRGQVASPLTQRSIVRWAQVSDPEGFRRVSEQSYFVVLSKYVYEYGGFLEHAMVARVLHAMLGHKFVVDVDEGLGRRNPYVWYEFVVAGQAARPGEVWKWRREAEPDELQKYISEKLVKVFDQVAHHLDEQAEAAEEEAKAKYYTRLGAAFQGSRRKLFNDVFKNGVVKQANYLFRRRNFAEALDRDPASLGVGNGVLRLGPACALVDRFHELPVMKFTPVAYRPFDPAEPWTALMLKAMADIIPEPDFRDWLLHFAASSLAGGVKEGLLLLWHGGGANGKTWFMRMVAKVLGKHYATKLDIGLLTAERSKPNDPNTAIMQLKGVRWGYVEETRKAEPMNDQRLKEIVNPGEISGNEKFKQQETFEVTANVAVGQNYDFVVDTTDHGTWRRLKHYHSKIRFCSNPAPGNPFEKKDDQRYVREYINDPGCQAAFLSILVHYYERLQREHGGLLKNVECPTLDRETEEFRNSQDAVNRFVTQMVVLSPEKQQNYTLATLAQIYHEWYDKNVGRRRHVASETIQDLENSALGKYIRRASNGSLLLSGCRVLEKDADSVLHGESFLGVTAKPPRSQAGAGAGKSAAARPPVHARRGASGRWWEAPPAAAALDLRSRNKGLAGGADAVEYEFLAEALADELD